MCGLESLTLSELVFSSLRWDHCGLLPRAVLKTSDVPASGVQDVGVR